MIKQRSDEFLALILDCIEYDESSKSCLRWKKKRSTNPKVVTGGEALCSVNGRGYMHGFFEDSHVLSHMVVYFLKTGEWPKECIDHIDGDKLNNKFSNIRQSGSTLNARNQKINKNNKSGHHGVRWVENRGKWMARGKRDGKTIYLGIYANINDAINAVETFKASVGGYTERHGII